MPTHHLSATCDTVHLGGFSDQLPPALVVDSGDRIRVETFTGFYLCDQAPPEFAPPELLAIRAQLPNDRRVGLGSHLLTGPIAVRQAEPGAVLEVQLEAIAPRLAIGFNAIRPGWGLLAQRFQEPALNFIPLDLARGTAEFPPGSGIHLPLRPFFGILGVATAEAQRHPPRSLWGQSG